MKYRFFVASILTVSLLASCQESISTETDFEGVMRISAVYPGALTKASGNTFEAGDCIGLFVTEYDNDTPRPLQLSGNWANNIACSFDGDSWNPAMRIFWGKGKMDVYGYYPSMGLISVDDQPYFVSLDQSISTAGEMSDYEASDLLWAKAEGVSSEDDVEVQLQFKHIMSKLVVKLVKGPDYQGVFPDEGELFVHNLVAGGLVDLARGEVIKDPYATPETIKARQIAPDTFEVILIPQRLSTRRPFLEYIANGVSFLLEDTFNFRTGVQYTINLTINANPDQVAIEIGAETGEW